MTQQIRIDPATPADVPMIRILYCELAEFERLLHEANATDEQIHESLFGPKPGAEVIMARVDDEVAGFALFFHNFSPSSVGAVCISKTCSCDRGFGAAVAEVRSCGILRSSRSSAIAADSSGRRSTGISEQSTSIRIWAPYRWTSGRSIALPVRHWKSSRTANPN